MRALLRVSLYLLLGGLALDFRGSGDQGPSIVQYLFLVVSFAGGTGVIVSGLALGRGRIVTGSRFGSTVLVIALGFCAWAPVALVVSSDTAHDDFLSVFLPYLLYAQSLLATLLALQLGFDQRRVIRILIVVAAISCAWRLLYAVTLGGVELTSARWQILSPALPLILGASVAALTSRVHRRLAIIGMAYFFAIVLLSITRGYLVGLFFVLLAAAVTARSRGANRFAGMGYGRIAVLLISIGTSLAALMLVLPPEVSERWVGRLGGEKSTSGEEITLLYRLAQFKGQYDGLMRSEATLLAGRGFGAGFIFDEVLLSSLSFVAPDDVIERTNGSDSTWGYPIFAHGIVLGPLFLGAFLMSVIRAVRYRRGSTLHGPAAYPHDFVCYSLAALLGISLTGNIFGERLGGVMIGALVALLLWQTRALSGRRSIAAEAGALPLSARPGPT